MNKAPLPPKQFNFKTTKYTFTEGSHGTRSSAGYLMVIDIISGKMRFTLDDTEKILCPGDTLILNSYDSVNFDVIEECRHYAFTIDQTKHFDELCIPSLTRFDNFIFNDETIVHMCEMINEEYEIQGVLMENMLISLSNQLLIYLYRNYNQSTAPSLSAQLIGRHKIAHLAIDYIHKNTGGITTSDISAHINVSTSYLCRCFKEATGVSVLEYAERIRCRKAKEDLSLGIYTVTQIAEKYNFNSLSYFNRRYKKYCGENPAKTLSEAKRKRN